MLWQWWVGGIGHKKNIADTINHTKNTTTNCHVWNDDLSETYFTSHWWLSWRHWCFYGISKCSHELSHPSNGVKPHCLPFFSNLKSYNDNHREPAHFAVYYDMMLCIAWQLQAQDIDQTMNSQGESFANLFDKKYHDVKRCLWGIVLYFPQQWYVWILVKLPSGENHKTSLIIIQHWFS